MAKTLHSVLTRRERQIMDILFRRGRATAAEVMEELPGETTYSTVRTQLRVLEEKGHVRHEEVGLRYVYMPAVARTAAREEIVELLARYAARDFRDIGHKAIYVANSVRTSLYRPPSRIRSTSVTANSE